MEAFFRKEITLCGKFKIRDNEKLLIEEGIDNDRDYIRNDASNPA